MNTINITNFNDLTIYAEKLPNELEWFNENSFSFADNIQGIKIHISGERFNSSMSTTLMRSILKLQEAIYHQYSLYAYGKKIALSAEEKAMLEIYAKVDAGSSLIELIPTPIIKAVSQRIKSMSNKQMLIGIASVSIAGIVCLLTSNILNYKLKIKELEIQAASLQGIQKTAVAAQIEAIKAQKDFYKEIIKLEGVEKIEINGNK